jgi:hypothetical protein
VLVGRAVVASGEEAWAGGRAADERRVGNSPVESAAEVKGRREVARREATPSVQVDVLASLAL